jgi:CBS domain-containing membrane protein
MGTGADENSLAIRASKDALWHSVRGLLGVDSSRAAVRDVLVSGLGGCVAIAAIVYFCNRFVGAPQAGALLVASMGASAVLLFALPHGPLSQPWAVIGGHGSSAVVGVAWATLVSDLPIAAALAVGSSIALMQVLRCVHPPGGATALSAVIGGPTVHALGMRYVLTPVLLNAMVIVSVAVAFNALLGSRPYPAFLAGKRP